MGDATVALPVTIELDEDVLGTVDWVVVSSLVADARVDVAEGVAVGGSAELRNVEVLVVMI